MKRAAILLVALALATPVHGAEGEIEVVPVAIVKAAIARLKSIQQTQLDARDERIRELEEELGKMRTLDRNCGA